MHCRLLMCFGDRFAARCLSLHMQLAEQLDRRAQRRVVHAHVRAQPISMLSPAQVQPHDEAVVV